MPSTDNDVFLLMKSVDVISAGQVAIMYDARHKKTDLKAYVVVIPKEGWERVAVYILLLIWHRLLENMIYEVKRLKF